MNETIQLSVQSAMDAYASAEKHLREAQKELAKVSDTYKVINESQLVGWLEARKNTAGIKSIVGEIAYVEELVLQKHSDDTARAQELGIDIPQTESLGPR